MDQRDQLDQLATALQNVNRYLRYSTFGHEDSAITRVQWVLLRTLYRHPGLPIGQLADRLGVRQSTVSQMLDKLEASGYAARRPHPRDTRVKTVELTTAGHDLIRRTEALWTEALVGPFEQFSPGERLMLVELMQRLSDALPKREEPQ